MREKAMRKEVAFSLFVLCLKGIIYIYIHKPSSLQGISTYERIEILI